MSHVRDRPRVCDTLYRRRGGKWCINIRLPNFPTHRCLVTENSPALRSSAVPHHEYPDEVSDPKLIIKELRGVIRRQRILLIVSVIINIALLVKVYGRY